MSPVSATVMENMEKIQPLTSLQRVKDEPLTEDEYEEESNYGNETDTKCQIFGDTTSFQSSIVKREDSNNTLDEDYQANRDCEDSQMLTVSPNPDHALIKTEPDVDMPEDADYSCARIKQECPSDTEESIFRDMFIVSDFLNRKPPAQDKFSTGHSEISKTKSNKKTFQCPLCDQQFTKFTSYTKHAACHSPKDVSVNVNDSILSSDSSTLNATPDNIYLEDIRSNLVDDGGGQKSQASDSNVAKKKRNRKPYVSTKVHYCDECDYSSNHLNNYRTHKRKHTGERPFSCDECSYTSAQLVHLKSHKLIHSEEKPHLCFLCPFKSRDTRYLNKHSKRHLKNKSFECNQCNFICGDIVDWKVHGSIHSAETTLQCDSCDYSCKRRERLNIHVRIHSGDAPYRCENCKFTCGDISQLKKHKLIHTPKDPLICNVCSYTTIWSRHMSLHKRTHTGEKPYACDKCDYTCTQIGHLKTHRRTHTGEKPYSCDLCDHTSAQISHMKLHRLSHSDEKPFVCTLCPFRCKTGQDLRRHSKKHVTSVT